MAGPVQHMSELGQPLVGLTIPTLNIHKTGLSYTTRARAAGADNSTGEPNAASFVP